MKRFLIALTVVAAIDGDHHNDRRDEDRDHRRDERGSQKKGHYNDRDHGRNR